MADSGTVPLSVGMGNYDIGQMTFQNVIDELLRAYRKMGGFPMEMFVDLTEADQEKFMCNLRFMVAMTDL